MACEIGGTLHVWNVFCHICVMFKILGILLLVPSLSFGQNYFKNHFGATVGVVLDFGSHVNTVGINFKGYYTDFFYQANLSSTISFYGNGYGKRKHFWETRNAFGIVLLTGKKEMDVDFQLDGLNHQTPFNLGVGYNYILYRDNAGTSQNSGGFALHVKNVSVYHENDVFGGRAKDRFRTGHFYITYRQNDFKVGLGVNLWTGESSGAKWEKIHLDKAPNGFKILEDLPYGKTSHGILYGAFIYNLPYGQDVHLKLGLDSENIRHGIQNRLIHDMFILPGLTERINRVTPHYPRLDKYGCPVFDNNIPPSSLFLQFGMNQNWSN